MDIKDFIRKRIAGGETQTKIAEKCGISQATVNKIANSNTVHSMDILFKIAKAYNLPMADIINEDRPAHAASEIVREGSPGYNPQKESARLVEQLAQSGVDPIKLAYLKQLSELPLEELHKIYLDRLYAAGGIPKGLKE